jgi:ABC-type antimicrobial peptide transport system permease subunit
MRPGRDSSAAIPPSSARRFRWTACRSGIIATVNISLLLLTRGAARERELAVRLALGAGRGRLIAQLFAQGLTLGAVGGVCGLGLAWLLPDVLLRLAPPDLPRPSPMRSARPRSGRSSASAASCSRIRRSPPARGTTRSCSRPARAGGTSSTIAGRSARPIAITGSSASTSCGFQVFDHHPARDDVGQVVGP